MKIQHSDSTGNVTIQCTEEQLNLMKYCAQYTAYHSHIKIYYEAANALDASLREADGNNSN